MMKNAWIAVPYLCILAYVGFIFFTSDKCMQGMEDFYDKPYHLNKEVRELRSRLQTLRNTLPIVFSSPQISYQQIEQMLKEHNKLQDESLEIIRKSFPDDPNGLLDQLHHYKDELRAARLRVAKATEGNSNFDSAVAYYTSEIVPPLDKINEVLSHIGEISDAQGNAILHGFEQRHILIKLAAIALCLLVFAVLIYMAYRDRLKLRAIQHRERLFNLLSQNVDDVFFISDRKNRIEFASSNSDRILNLPSKEILNDPDAIYRRLGSAGEWLKRHIEEEEGGEVDTDLDDGEKKLLIKIYPVTEGDSLERSIVMVRDQTEMVARERALKDALENSRQASAAKSDFLAHMSHEIRTPMNAIIGMSTIALTKINDLVRVRDCLAKIGQSSRHLLGLINDVLDMSKIERGKLSTNYELFNLRATVENIVNIIRPQALERGLNFELELSGMDSESLFGDPLRLNQVILNLLSNALKFTPTGGEILFRVAQVKKEPERVLLRFIVKDSGIGMSQDFLSKVFSPFEQATPGVAARFGGSGLGLAITKNLVSLMGGVITLKSEEDKGTEFTVELPFTTPPAGSEEGSDNLESRKILVVDDDPSICEEAEMLLKGMGMEVETTVSGETALEMLRQAAKSGQPFDVCFLDWKMPVMDGETLAGKISAQYGEDVAMIVISSYDWSDIAEQANRAGVSGFVTKPFFASSLRGALISIDDGKLNLPPKEKKYDFTGRKVLLVEDNEFNREISQEFLEMVNVEVENAANGQEAVDKFSSSPPGFYDLILMDIQMPVLNGYQAAQAIRHLSREDAGNVPIIAMTANAFNEDVARSREAGMNDHIPKPINVAELYSKMEKHLTQPSEVA